MTDHIKNICKIGQGAKCCKYLVATGNGFECMKVNESFKKIIDDNWNINTHISQGNNCDGISDLKILNG